MEVVGERDAGVEVVGPAVAEVVVGEVGGEIEFVVPVVAVVEEAAGGVGPGGGVGEGAAEGEEVVAVDGVEFAQAEGGGEVAVDVLVGGGSVEAVDGAGGEAEGGLPAVAGAVAEGEGEAVGIEVEVVAGGVVAGDAVVVALVGEAEGGGEEAVAEGPGPAFESEGEGVGEDGGVAVGGGGAVRLEEDVVGEVNLGVGGDAELEGEFAGLGDALDAGVFAFAGENLAEAGLAGGGRRGAGCWARSMMVALGSWAKTGETAPARARSRARERRSFMLGEKGGRFTGR